MIYNAIMVMFLLLIALPSGATRSVATLEPAIESNFKVYSDRTKVVDEKDQNDRGILSFLSWINEKIKKKIYAWLGISDNDDEVNTTLFWWWVSSLFLASVFFILGTYTGLANLAASFVSIPYFLGSMIGAVGLGLFVVWVVKVIA